MNGIIITAIICTTVVLLVWLGGRNEKAKAERMHEGAMKALDHPYPTWKQETRFGSNDKDGGK